MPLDEVGSSDEAGSCPKDIHYLNAPTAYISSSCIPENIICTSSTTPLEIYLALFNFLVYILLFLSMLLSSLYALGAVTTLVLASPLDKASARDTELRLIKTSEIDPGVWVTEDEKIDNYVSKKIHFVDITDIKDEQTLRLLSTTPKQANESDVDLLRAAVTYPTSLSHQSEANAIIGRLSNSGPQTWLKTLTE